MEKSSLSNSDLLNTDSQKARSCSPALVIPTPSWSSQCKSSHYNKPHQNQQPPGYTEWNESLYPNNHEELLVCKKKPAKAQIIYHVPVPRSILRSFIIRSQWFQNTFHFPLIRLTCVPTSQCLVMTLIDGMFFYWK